MTLSAACSATLCAPSLVTQPDVQGRAAFHRYSALNTYSAREKPQSGASRLRFACKLGTTSETRRLPRIKCLGGRMTCYAAKREVDSQEALKMEAIQKLIPGANIKKMVRSYPEILELTPDQVGNVMADLSEALIDRSDASLADLIKMVNSTPRLLRVPNMAEAIETTLKKMAEWEPNPEADDFYRRNQLVIYPSLLFRVPDYYKDKQWNEIPMEIQNMVSKTCCG
eukprot:CAMPEP_0198212950 /NCGR_PEP_ID=MMETSP1445-20131203/28402_1 /TAXON_ID=36898 /ORGANISM="Pyramimonas sp., Strain CCMP2087" /LENGTH=225 /DNA_ID=CAMNT_0043887527 /DNA_START=209 /DNA_END=886 /DNA_ORIENTATION=+